MTMGQQLKRLHDSYGWMVPWICVLAVSYAGLYAEKKFPTRVEFEASLTEQRVAQEKSVADQKAAQEAVVKEQKEQRKDDVAEIYKAISIAQQEARASDNLVRGMESRLTRIETLTGMIQSQSEIILRMLQQSSYGTAIK